MVKPKRLGHFLFYRTEDGMSKKDYTPIGGIMTRNNGKKYEVKSGRSCCNCSFREKSAHFCEDIPCAIYQRNDGIPAIFIRRKDLEEPKQEPADSQ